MYWLVEIAVINAVTAAVLGAGVLSISRWIKRPAVIHALWVLVLLKLVTPPMVEIPLGLRIERLATWSETDEKGSGRMTRIGSYRGGAEDAEDQPREVGQNKRSAVLSTQNTHAGTALRLFRPTKTAAGSDPRDAAADTLPPAERRTSNVQRPTSNTASGSTFDVRRSTFDVRSCLAYLMPFILWTWLAGSVVWFVVQASRIVRFQRLLRAIAVPADRVLQQQTRQLSAALGIRRPPRVWIVPATISPTLWGIGSKAQLLFPKDLLRRVDAESRATLLTHELAHYYRCDHWVRLLELVVTGLYWWHPAVWLARREIEAAEEQCCDAWVVGQHAGPRRYAEALLDTIDFLSETPRCVPPAASGLGSVPFLRKRLTMIMRGVAPKSMSGTARLAVLVLFAVLLPLGPKLFAAAVDETQAAVGPSDVASVEIRKPATVGPEVSPGESTTEPAPPLAAPEPQQTVSASASDTPVAHKTDIREPFPAVVEETRAWATATSPNGRFQVVAETDGSLSLIHTLSGRTFDLTAYRITSVAFSADSTILAAGSLDAVVYLFDAASGEPAAALHGHAAAVRSVAIEAGGKWLASGSQDGAVKLWDLETREEVLGIPTQTSVVSCVRFSPDGRLLAFGSGNWMSGTRGHMAVLDLRTSKLTRTFATTSPVGALAFTADSKLIVAGWGGLVEQWDLALQTAPSITVQVDKDMVSAAAFAPGNEVELINAVKQAVSQAR